MLREKLELGAVALRVLSWVVIPNLRFSKAGKRKKKREINTQLRGQTQADTGKRAGPQGADVGLSPPAVQWVDIQVKAETVEPALCSEVTSKFAIKE